MVRVGGGWVTLQKFLENHDPCKAKGRTNSELREQFTLADGVSQTRGTFSSRRHSSKASNPGSDAGYSSAGSSAGSSSSLSGRKGALTPTPRTPEGGRVTPLRRKAATPTPRGVARTPPPHR